MRCPGPFEMTFAPSRSLGSGDMNPVVVVHGGAGSRVSQDREERVRQGVARAAAAGYRVLTEGGSALDAVESAVAALEDDPEFNAGECAPRGSG